MLAVYYNGMCVLSLHNVCYVLFSYKDLRFDYLVYQCHFIYNIPIINGENVTFDLQTISYEFSHSITNKLFY